MKTKTLRKHLKQIGQTVTGKPILGGAFFMSDTMGYPLGMQIIHAHELGAVVSIPAFVADAVSAGWLRERAIREVREELRMIGRLDDAKLVVAALEQSR